MTTQHDLTGTTARIVLDDVVICMGCVTYAEVEYEIIAIASDDWDIEGIGVDGMDLDRSIAAAKDAPELLASLKFIRKQLIDALPADMAWEAITREALA